MIKHFLLLLLVLAQTLYAAAGLEAAEIPPKPQAGSNIYVQDYADVISPASEKIIYSIGRELDSKTTAQVAVLTVPTLDGEPIESYALKVLRGWGIGSRDKNNGVLIVVATQDRQSRIEVGYGLEGALPDGLTGRLQDDTMLPYFKQGQYDKGIVNGYAATAATVAKEYNVKLEGVSYTPPAPKQNDSLPLWAELAIGIGIVLLLVIDNVFLGGFITQMLILSIFRRGGGGGFGGGGFSMEDIFSQFGDIFGGHFSGGSYRTSSSGGRRVSRGTDIRVRVKLSLAEIAAGTVKKLKINKQIACPKCGGTGAKDANSYSTCSTCNGAGYVNRVENTFFGRMQTQSVCPTCGGTGKVITNPCDECKGEGTIKGSEVVEIRIPAGVGDGMVLTVSGKGNAARHGGVNGDLQVVIEEEHNPELVRDGNDLIHNLNITVPTALLGGSVEVPTVDGRARIKIAPGTPAGKVLRLAGKGLPDVNGYGRGDILVVVDVTVPAKLNAEEKRLVEQLAAQPSFQRAEASKGHNIFDRMKSFFR